MYACMHVCLRVCVHVCTHCLRVAILTQAAFLLACAPRPRFLLSLPSLARPSLAAMAPLCLLPFTPFSLRPSWVNPVPAGTISACPPSLSPAPPQGVPAPEATPVPKRAAQYGRSGTDRFELAPVLDTVLYGFSSPDQVACLAAYQLTCLPDYQLTCEQRPGGTDGGNYGICAGGT